MKKLTFTLALAIFLGLPATLFAKPAKRITFARGATKAVATGKLKGYRDSADFVIRLRAGQTLKVSSNRDITLGILDPSGEDVMDHDLGCNGKAEISPTVAGDYKIIVTVCGKVDEWRGAFKLWVAAK